MRFTGFGFVTLLLALLALGTPARAQLPDPYGAGPHLARTLVAETKTPAAGSTITLAIESRPQRGWHGYWRNPGDAGFPAKLEWTLPDGVAAGTPIYPVPQTLLLSGLMNYVFDHDYALLVPLRLPAGLAAGTRLPIRLHMTYLVCTVQVCVPEEANLATDLTIGDGRITPLRRARFDHWRQRTPKPLGIAAHYQRAGDSLRIGIPYPADAPLADAYFFPLSTGRVDYAAPQRIVRDGDRVVIETKAAGTASAPIDGVLRIGDGQGLRLTADPGGVPAASGTESTAASVWRRALLAFGAAILGGLILNIMPCVFPILSLKALSLARAGVDERAARAEALAYSAGVVLSCIALGGAILALRAGGTAVGWAFQLQDPRSILFLFLLTSAITLNLAGLFELPLPRAIGGLAGSGGAFATGMLAAFTATPCTGPFMGAALGAALILPWAAALAIFAGLGFGLALPFLALGFVPALRRRLPRPGAWMVTLRRVLAVPMALTALALAWVLWRQAGMPGLSIGASAAVALGFILWVTGKRQAKGRRTGWPFAVSMAVVLIAAVTIVAYAPRPAIAAVTGADAFSEARLARLRAAGRPVFAYFTADWCLTCKVNERAAIETDAVHDAFAKADVAMLVGDWTDGDPTLGRFIEAHNRAGVPLYLYYAPGAASPKVLPQILTPAMLVALAESRRTASGA